MNGAGEVVSLSDLGCCGMIGYEELLCRWLGRWEGEYGVVIEGKNTGKVE
jgi:hypothetical protein